MKKSEMLKRALLGAALLQIICLFIFLVDIAEDIGTNSLHSWIEAAGVMALGIGAFLNIFASRRLIARNQKVEDELHAASGAFQDVLEKRFHEWGLSAAERDVTLLSIKGVSINDIAKMRETKVGTIKAQCTAIYRKVGVSGRAELISVTLEEIIEGLETLPQ